MNRLCGGCTLCCKLLPIVDLDKKAGERCPSQRIGRGCAIYSKRPTACRLWSCRWLVDNTTSKLNRPDRMHYVIDVMGDFISMRDNETGEINRIPVVQIWCDPKHPHAHRDPALRDWLQERGQVGLVRYGSRGGVTIFPPSVTGFDEWKELVGESEPEHTAEEIRAVAG